MHLGKEGLLMLGITLANCITILQNFVMSNAFDVTFQVSLFAKERMRKVHLTAVLKSTKGRKLMPFHLSPCFSSKLFGQISLISNFRHVLNIVCVLLDISPASDCDLPTRRYPLSIPSSKAGSRAFEDGNDRGFRNVSKSQSDAREISKRTHTNFIEFGIKDLH
jgi:hypothetical protein